MFSNITSPDHHLMISASKCTHAAIDKFPRDIFSQGTRQHGAILLHILAVLYVFGALVYICSIYYVPCLESITRRFDINYNVAGATIVAIAGSVCELAITMFGTFVSKTDVGLGTVVGSASFSILFGLGLCAILAPQGLESSWYPILRESVFYLLSLIMVGILTYKQEVKWYEALALVTCYVAYVILVWLSQCCDRKCRHDHDCRVICHHNDVQNDFEEEMSLMYLAQGQLNEKHGSKPVFKGNKNMLDGYLTKKYEEEKPLFGGDNSIAKEDPDDICSNLKDNMKPPTGNFMFSLWLLGYPVILLFALSMPEHRDSNPTSSLLLTLMISLLYIGALSYCLLWMITIISLTLLVQDMVFGLVILAAAGCAPDIITSTILARHGLGDMCISSILGNCIFDLFIGLGLPWLLKAVIFRSPIKIISGSIRYSITILTVCVVCLLVSLAVNGFYIGKRSGIGLILVYFVTISIICLMELDVIGHLNLSHC